MTYFTIDYRQGESFIVIGYEDQSLRKYLVLDHESVILELFLSDKKVHYG